MTDFAYICPGSCQAAVVRPQCCKDERCTLKGQKLVRVPVVYVCPHSSCPNSQVPAVHQEDCASRGKCLVAKAVVTPKFQFHVLDPPEENRSYSSIHGNENVGEGHGRSKLGSVQGWSALENNSNQWMVIDVGSVVDSIRGLAVSNRKDGCHGQLVTKIAVDVATQQGVWEQVGDIYETNLVSQDCKSFVAIHFSQPRVARFIRIRPVEWREHISLRCGLILSGSALEALVDESSQDEYRALLDITDDWRRIERN